MEEMAAATRRRPIVEVRDLVKRYGPFPAVGGVSFEIAEGEIFGLLGPNGAGKTTLISMLSTLLAPTEGAATIAGFDVERQAAQVKHNIGLVPQEIALYLQLSARDNLYFFGRMYGLSGEMLRQRVDEALAVIELGPWADIPVGGYSGGMMRRANLAIGLLHKPRLLFLDEPTVGVDPQSRNHIFESILRLNREEGVTVLYTTHYMEEAQALCHRVGIIDHGHLIALDTPRNLINRIGIGVVQLSIEGDSQPLATKLESMPGAERIGQSDGRLEVYAKDAQAMLIPIMETVNALGLRTTHLEIKEPNLESVFLHLTGKRLRE